MNSIRKRVLLSYLAIIAGVIALLITTVILNYYLVAQYETVTSNIVEIQALNDTTSGLTDDAYSGFKSNDYRKYDLRLSQVREIEKNLDTRFEDNNVSLIAYRGVKNSLETVISDVVQVRKQLQQNGDLGSISSFYQENSTKYDYASQSITSLLLAETENLAKVTQQMERLKTILLIIIIGIVALGTLASAVLAYVFSGKITTPLINLALLAEKISTGNLEVNLEDEMLVRRDEIGSLFRSFTKMVQQLKERINNESRAKQNVEHLLSDSNALQQVIKEERDRARGIVASMGEGLFVLDKDLKLVLMNPAAERLLEVSGQPVIGRRIDDVVAKVLKGGQELPANERPSARTLLGASVNITIEDNMSFKLASGKEFSVAVATTPLNGENGITGLVEVFRDITPEKQSRAAIEQQIVERTKELSEKNTALIAAKEEISRGWLQIQMEKARLLASVNSITLGFLMVDSNGKTLIKNPAVERSIGIKGNYADIDSIDQILGKDFAIKDRFNKCLDERASADVKNINFNNKYFRLFMAPIFSTDNTLSVIGVVILIQDETESKILDRSKDEFFSIASHELRTPLTAIRGNTSLLEQYFGDKIAENPEMKEMVEDIHASSIRLINIVNDFLNVSRLEQGKMEYKIENFDLALLINKKIAEVSILAQEKNIQVKFDKPLGVFPGAYADKDRVGEVLLNLIGNAIKYSERGTVDVQMALLQGAFKVSVIDTGRGIAPEQQNLLFRKFQQAGKSLLTRDTAHSTGLGLYISRLMIEQMKGKIGLEKSVPGVGSTFAFTIPVATGI